MIYDGTIFLFYDEAQNCFYNTAGMIVLNVFGIITPNDLLLFHNDPGHCIFATPWPGVFCEICTLEDGYRNWWF